MKRPFRDEIKEAEANTFAMELLVPEGILQKELAKYKNGFDLCDEKALKELARRFGVPTGVMGIRLGQLLRFR